MSVNWSTAPVEIWMLIFNYVGDLTDLLKCRFVCKAWDPLTEKATFGEDLYFNNANTLTGFYNHLVGKLLLTLQISDMGFGNIDMDTSPFHRDFFQFAFTLTVRSVRGFISDELLKIILGIAQGSTKRFEKLTY